MQAKNLAIFPLENHSVFYPPKEHLFSGHRADIVRTSCILCGIIFLLCECYRHKNDHFYSLSAKIIPKKFGNFSTTDKSPHGRLMTDEYLVFLHRLPCKKYAI